jgi:IclR family acetate operon transcriptional repressor
VTISSDAEAGGTRIRSVARACRLLALLARRPAGCTAADAARELELTVPTTHHLLNTLAGEGLVVKDSQRRFALGPQVAVLADGLVHQVVPEYLARPLRAVAEATGETAYLAAWDGGTVRVLGSVEGARAVRVAEVERGPYRHGHARATGKLLLAFARPEVRAAYLAANPPVRLTERTIADPAALEAELDAVRERGFSEDREEFVEGVSCVSAPLLADGVVVAAFTVSAPSQRYDRHRAELRDAVLAAAAAAQSPPADDLRRSA